MKWHISAVARNCFYRIRQLKQIRRLLGSEVMVKLMTSIFSWLDYCNAVLAGLPILTISPLQRVQNAAAWLVTQLRPRDHVTPAMSDLHWLPVEYRITYKLCLLMHRIHNVKAALYLTDIATATLGIESCSGLRSASSDRYKIPQSWLWFRERRFAVAGPRAWNNLSTCLHQTRSTVTFKRHLLSPFDLNEYTLASFYLITFNCFFLSLFTAGHVYR